MRKRFAVVISNPEHNAGKPYSIGSLENGWQALREAQATISQLLARVAFTRSSLTAVLLVALSNFLTQIPNVPDRRPGRYGALSPVTHSSASGHLSRSP